MNRHVNTISNRLSLREPQRYSLEILSYVTEILPLTKDVDLESVLDLIKQRFPHIKNFERDFPSFCFSLATGVGKTRLMGAFIIYLYLVHNIKNFFVLAPNLTIYNKLIKDFTAGTEKYVFKGIAEFAINPPEVITGDDYLNHKGTIFDRHNFCKINIFNISKINMEVRGGKTPKIKSFAEYIGQSYFEYLAELPDLVLLMDESHRYRATSGIRAINELKPILGLELTATPFVEINSRKVCFQNIIYDYALGQAIEDGFVKDPAVMTRKNFNPTLMSPQELERFKLEEGIRLHENTKVELEIYARETNREIVKPFVLIIAHDIEHARQLQTLIKSDDFFGGNYENKVIQVDSGQKGEKEEEMIQRLLAVENSEESTEIVIHVNKLKEGWDVTNLYTIIPLRAANARILVEQSIGRGLRLPYGKRTGVDAVDRLSIIAHDKFQEIVDDSKKQDSPVRLKQIFLTDDDLNQKREIIRSRLRIEESFSDPIVKIIEDNAKKAVYKLGRNDPIIKALSDFNKPEIYEQLVLEVEQFPRGEIKNLVPSIDTQVIVQKTLNALVKGTIQVPRISVVPKNAICCGFTPFNLNLEGMSYQPPDSALWGKYLQGEKSISLPLVENKLEEYKFEGYIVSSLIGFDDVPYDDNADLLYNLSGQVVEYLQSYLSDDDINRVLKFYRQDIARFIHTQMQEHYWEESTEYDVQITGFVPLKDVTYSRPQGQQNMDFRNPLLNKESISSYIFSGFEKCLFDIQKFDSNPERQMAIILDRDSIKWFTPARDQFEIYYRSGTKSSRYQPDFVAETVDNIYMIEVKASNQMSDRDVLAKKKAASIWCQRASGFTKSVGGKPWAYLLIPDGDTAENMTLEGLKGKYLLKGI